MAKQQNAPYGLLARFYEEVLPGMDAMNRHARGHMLGKRLADVKSVCDLACGSGGTAMDLARAGKKMFAVDNSPEFCRIVRAKAREEKLTVNVRQADMRDFSLSQPVDLVTCEFAALNNLADRADLTRVFRSVFRALRPGGWFLFDVNTLRSLKDQGSGDHWQESPRFRLVMRCQADLAAKHVRLDLEWFLPVKQLWRHVRETIWNVAWSDREIRDALREAGFERPQTREGLDVRPPIPGAKPGCDLYYLTRKPA